MKDTEFLREILLSPDPIVTTSELTEQLPLSRQGVHNRLAEFEEENKVKSRKVGAKARVWWLTDNGRRLATRSKEPD